MLKMLGAAVIILTCSVSAVRAVVRLNSRVRSLRSLCLCADVMKNEIGENLMPVPELFELLAEMGDGPAGRLFENARLGLGMLGRESLYSIWKKAVENTPGLGLTQTEKETVEEMGLCLGRYGAENQAAMLGRIAFRLETYRKRAEEERGRDIKLQAYLGVISGVFVVIVLL